MALNLTYFLWYNVLQEEDVSLTGPVGQTEHSADEPTVAQTDETEMKNK